MKSYILSMLLKALVSMLLKNTVLAQLRGLVAEAETLFNNPMSKRGYVYRELRKREPQTAVSTINLMVELGVLAVKGVR